MPIGPDCRTNLLIGSLFLNDLSRWLSLLENVELAPGEVIFDATHLNGYIYFPTSATVEMLHAKPDLPPVSVAVVGSEGAVGIAIYIAGIAAPSAAVVLTGGGACRMASSTFLAEFHRKDGPMPLLLRYTVALTAKLVEGIARTA